MVQELQQRSYLPSFSNDENNDDNDTVLESRHSSSSGNVDLALVDDIDEMVSSSSLRSQSSLILDKDISWSKLKRSK